MRDRRSGTRRGGARWVRRALAGALVLAGHAHAQTVIFEEDFENRPGSTPIVHVDQYVGVTGTTYTASPTWLSNCNGWVARVNQPISTAAGAGAQVTDCTSQVAWNIVQQQAQALGVFRGETLAQARDNFAVSAVTMLSGIPVGEVQIETSQLPLAGANGRFITFTVDATSYNCALAAPLFHFYLVSAGGTETSLGGTVNVCAASNTNVAVEAVGDAPATALRVGTFNSPGALLYNGGPTFAVRMRNEQSGTNGNDGAIDNLRVLDVTPRLVKAFQTPILAGQPSTLTLTVTNTPDNLQKQGWQFTDNLTSGLVIATPNGLTSTCTGTTVSAPAGGTSIAVSNGNLPAGASCVISVNVVAAAVGSYTNNASNITNIVSIDPPTGTTTLEVVQNHITLSKRSLGGVGAFFLSGNNGVTGETLTTTVIGTAVAGTRRLMTVGSATTDTTILDSAAAGWRVRTATCSGLAVGVTPIVNTPANTVTIPFAGLAPTSGGREVACTLTNSVDTDLSITKQNASPTGGTVNAGTTTRYTVTATNQGPLAITGATVQDTPGTGITCPPANPVTCTGTACPGGGLTVANLTTAPGVTLGLLGVGQNAAFAFDCTVNIP